MSTKFKVSLEKTPILIMWLNKEFKLYLENHVNDVLYYCLGVLFWLDWVILQTCRVQMLCESSHLFWILVYFRFPFFPKISTFEKNLIVAEKEFNEKISHISMIWWHWNESLLKLVLTSKWFFMIVEWLQCIGQWVKLLRFLSCWDIFLYTLFTEKN